MNKPRLKWAALMMAAMVSITACKKDDDNGDGDGDGDGGETTTHTVEENKDRVEASGVAFVQKMDKMEDLEAVGLADVFTGYLGDSEMFNSEDDQSSEPAMKKFKSYTFFKHLKMIAAMDEGKTNSLDLMQAMKTSVEDTTSSDEDKSLDEIYDELQGTFAWTPDSNDFVHTEGTNGIIFEFPSTETGTSNDASITINYSSTDVDLPFGIEEEYTDMVPTAFTAVLAVGGTEHIKHELNITWLSVGLPGTISNTLTIAPFVMSVDVNYDEATAGVSYSFKDGTENLLSYGASVGGDISVASIQSEIDAEEADTTGEYSPSDDLVTTASAWIQIMDIKVNGTIAPVEIINAIEDIEEKEDNGTYTEEEAVDAGADAVNEHVGISIIHTENNETIATLEAFGEEYTDTWTEYDYVWNDATQEYDEVETEVTETDYDLNFRMKYPDGSAVDMETYFEEGFDDVVDELNAFFEEMNAEYDAGFETIEYNVD